VSQDDISMQRRGYKAACFPVGSVIHCNIIKSYHLTTVTSPKTLGRTHSASEFNLTDHRGFRYVWLLGHEGDNTINWEHIRRIQKPGKEYTTKLHDMKGA